MPFIFKLGSALDCTKRIAISLKSFHTAKCKGVVSIHFELTLLTSSIWSFLSGPSKKLLEANEATLEVVGFFMSLLLKSLDNDLSRSSTRTMFPWFTAACRGVLPESHGWLISMVGHYK